MWNRFDQVRPVRGRDLADPEAARHATLALRFELLYAAVTYGLYCVQAEDGSGAHEWREWLRWIEDLVIRRGERHDRVRHGFEPDQWIQEAIRSLERSRVGGFADPFDDPGVQRWARERFEELAVRARPLEREAAEPLAEIKGVRSRAAKRLFAAVTDSLVLASSDDPETRKQRAAGGEILQDLVTARDEGAWKVLLSR